MGQPAGCGIREATWMPKASPFVLKRASDERLALQMIRKYTSVIVVGSGAKIILLPEGRAQPWRKQVEIGGRRSDRGNSYGWSPETSSRPIRHLSCCRK